MIKHNFIPYLENENIAKKQTLKKGTSLLLPKMDLNEIHYLATGLCKAFWLDHNNEEQIFQIWAENSLVTLWEYFFAEQRNDAVYIMLMEDSELLSINKVQLDMICMRYPEITTVLHAIRAEQMELRNLQHRIMMRKEGDRYGLFCKGFPALRQRLSDKDTCAFLGIGRSTLTQSKGNLPADLLKF